MTRPRPIFHFTVEQGWTGDPHGILYFNDQYHMFYQHNPYGVKWNKATHWGHAVSDDLIVWKELPVALTPENEIGCWSGSAVVQGDQVTILYTTIRHEDPRRGAVALATSSGDLLEWKRVAGPDVIGPPSNLDIICLTDPFVWREGDAWKAILCSGLVGFGGCAMQYSSPDLKTWKFDGIIAKKANSDHESVWTGKLWECPQLVDLGGKWLMIVSIQEDDVPYYVAYALGDYDGFNFISDKWGRFSYGPSAYATSTFRDQDDKPQAISWLREIDNLAPEGSPWCSAIGLPFELSLSDGELLIRHNKRIYSHLQKSKSISAESNTEAQGPVFIEVSIPAGTEGSFEICAGENSRIIISLDAVTLLNELGNTVLALPRTRRVQDSTLEISIDADIMEVTWSNCSGIGAIRISASEQISVRFEPRSFLTGKLFSAL